MQYYTSYLVVFGQDKNANMSGIQSRNLVHFASGDLTWVCAKVALTPCV